MILTKTYNMEIGSEDVDVFTLESQAGKMHGCLFDIESMFSDKLKGHPLTFIEKYLLEELQKEFYEILQERKFDLFCVS
ncbi:MAG: hypothetical protein GY853_01690 [PVC group bacterium]|nr:hypothetical protein [PVC group bacterium]